MPEIKSGQKSLYDLAKALNRWDNEGEPRDYRQMLISDQIWHSTQLKSGC